MFLIFTFLKPVKKNTYIPKISCQLLQEDPDVRLAIQEALSMMVGAYINLQGALLNLMEALVAAYIAKVSTNSSQTDTIINLNEGRTYTYPVFFFCLFVHNIFMTLYQSFKDKKENTTILHM